MGPLWWKPGLQAQGLEPESKATWEQLQETPQEFSVKILSLKTSFQIAGWAPLMQELLNIFCKGIKSKCLLASRASLTAAL